MKKALVHSNMKILLVFILLVLSVAFCFMFLNVNTAFAQTENIPAVKVESKTVHRGQTFSIDVDISQNEGLISLYLTVDYNESVMALRDVIQGDALSSLTLTTTNVNTPQGYGIKPFNILWDGKDADNSNGTLVTLIFDSFIDAPVGNYPITFTYDRLNTNVAYQTPTDISIDNGVVTLITGEYEAVYRDYNGDVLYNKDYNADDIPSYPSSLPTPFREEDAEYSYEFIGWKGVPSGDLNTLIYEADYRFIPQVYTLFFYVDGINGYPDGIIDENDFFQAFDLEFGAIIETPRVPEKRFYQFYGWYADESFQTTFIVGTMSSHDIHFYGYYSFDVRERDLPIISLEEVVLSDNLESVVVTANLIANTGFNGLVLTLNYDSEALTFEGFEQLDTLSSMQFDTTNTQDLSVENFKFYFESATNNYETGSFLKLYFKVKENVPEDIYRISFDYDYHTDATYINNAGEIKYTMIQFYNAEVPVGEINHWVRNLSKDRAVDMTSQNGKPINVYLEVELLDNEVVVEDDDIKVNVGKRMYVSSAYQIKLMQNRQEIQPNTTLTIRIKLTEEEQKGNIKFYYLTDNNELISHDFRVENGELIFTTNHLSSWIIFNDYNENSYNTNLLFLIGMPIILAIATMLYALRLKQKIAKLKKGAHND